MMRIHPLNFSILLFFLLASQTTSYGQSEKQLCGTYQKENLRNISKEDADLIDQLQGSVWRNCLNAKKAVLLILILKLL